MSKTDTATELRARLEALSNGTGDSPATPLESALLPAFKQYRGLKGQKVLVLFSGGLDTSYIVHFLSHIVGAEVVTMTADVGTTEPRGASWAQEQESIRERAVTMGAVEHVMVDCREKLAELAMNAVNAEAQLDGGRGHPPGSSLSRVLISEAAIDTIDKVNGEAIFHGSNGTQNNPYRYHNALQHFGGQHKMIVQNSSGRAGYEAERAIAAVLYEKRGELGSLANLMITLLHEYGDKARHVLEATPNLDCPLERDMAEAYLKKFGISTKKDSVEGNISTDENLCGNEREEAGISDVGHLHYPLTHEPAAPLRLSIRFEKGKPVAMKQEDGDWEELAPLALMNTLNRLGYERHVGVFDNPESRPIGTREREIHVSPALTILNHAHYLLRKNTLTPYQSYLFNTLSNDWSTLVMEANQWVEPSDRPRAHLRERLDQAFQELNEAVTGEISLTLSHGRLVAPQIVSDNLMKSQDVTGVTSAEVESYAGLPTTVDIVEPDKTVFSIMQREKMQLPPSKGKLEALHQECVSFMEQVFSMRDKGVTTNINDPFGFKR